MSQLLSKKIIAWYQKHQRSLPWRTYRGTLDRDYKVLLSEIMLQQTKVSTVVPYFNKFYKKFPNIKSLSKARITSVMKQWEGLGYYRRAKNLHQTCKILANQYDSVLPNSFLELKKLPGIGDYTASAIMAIAKDQAYIGIDGNVKRVISRVYSINQNQNLIINLEKKLNKMKMKKNSSSLMQGIMEIGALICAPKNPTCKLCPIKKDCQFSLSIKKIEKPKITKIKEISFFAFYSKKNDKVLFSYNKNYNFLKGLINLPLIEITKNINLKDVINSKFKSSKIKFKKIPKIIYKMSNMKMFIYPIILKNVYINNSDFFWIEEKKLIRYALPVLAKKIIKFIYENDR